MEKLKKRLKDPANLFVLNIFIVYAGWKAFSYYIKNSSGWAHSSWLKLIIVLGKAYAAATCVVLNTFGEFTVRDGISVFYPVLNRKIRVEDHCLAIPATVIFIGTILLFKGSWKNKLWFIPVGILCISAINLLRLVFVCYTFAHFSEAFFDINHSVIYVVITYSLIFLLIAWWMRNFTYSKNDIAS